MKRLLLSAAAVAILAGAFAGASIAADTATPTDVAAPQRMGAWGFDLAGRDTSIAPGQDFFQYANGAYMKALVIPPDRSRYGTFDALTVLSENRTRAVLERASANPKATGDEAKIGAFYKAFMDEAAVEALDARPLAANLAAIKAATTRAQLAVLMGRSNTNYYNTFFQLYTSADAKAPTRYAVYTDQASASVTPTVTYSYDGINNLSRTQQGGAVLNMPDWIPTGVVIKPTVPSGFHQPD